MNMGYSTSTCSRALRGRRVPSMFTHSSAHFLEDSSNLYTLVLRLELGSIELSLPCGVTI